ncbi:unnamed protein product [Caenorhabditis sp. 36 PRJEB53466]|nr:unnamed protein product [Caenorhabditis sp. 36 PRJEB53466]
MTTQPFSTDFRPTYWTVEYKRFGPAYDESVEILKKLEEGEEKLMDILVKVTFVERNLTINGEQTAGELYENLVEAVGEAEPGPFASAHALSVFCQSMSPIFLLNPLDNKFRNSGRGFRLFVQFIFKQLQHGRTIGDEDMHEILNMFYDTFDETTSDFSKKEVLLDFKSFLSLSIEVPLGFSYDAETCLLSLKPKASTHLPLILPILATTLDSFADTLDKSRIERGVIKMTSRGYKNHRGTFLPQKVVCLFEPSDFEVKDRKKVEIPRQMYYVEAAVTPNRPKDHLRAHLLKPFNPLMYATRCDPLSRNSTNFLEDVNVSEPLTFSDLSDRAEAAKNDIVVSKKLAVVRKNQ